MTLAEHYGMPEDARVADVTWLADTAARGWIVFMKDARIRYRPAEKEAVRRHGARCFCLKRQDLSARAMADRFLRNLDAIAAACARSGPFIYAVHAERLEVEPLD